MQSKQDIVIIGGGIVGCSTAYHLAKLYPHRQVLVLEKGELTSGSTWHAAGLVGQLRSDRNITRMLKYSVELYCELQNETGMDTGWKQVGGLRLACSEARVQELKKAQSMARSFGLPMDIISPNEALERFPIMSTEKVLSAAYLPTDGYADPSGITMALAKAAQGMGVEFKKHILVEGMEVQSNKVTCIRTDQGDFHPQVVVNCGGLWARAVGNMVGAHIPLIPVMHQFMVSDEIKGLPKDLPTLRDPDLLIYYKQEMDGLVMGGYEPNPIPWQPKAPAWDFTQKLLPEDFDHFQQLSEPAMFRTPCLAEVGVKKLINGPEAFTPDGNFLLGQCPELNNFFVGAGFNAHGIAAGGGAGKSLAEWIVEGEPKLNLWSVDIRRFGPHTRGLTYVRNRTLELYGKHYAIHWPFEEHESMREMRKSPLYDRLKKEGGVFGSKYGFERAHYFLKNGDAAKSYETFGKPNWFDDIRAEHQHVREKVGVIDQSSFSKISISGSGAGNFLEYMCSNKVDKEAGKLTYTQLCNQHGGIEADLTVVKLAEDQFYLVTGTAFGLHDLHWLKKNLRPEDNHVNIQDITSSKGVLNICGPRSRQLLSRIVEEKMDGDAFRFGSAKSVHLGGVEVLALRVTYVGELGYELHINSDQLQYVYDLIKVAGEDLEIRDIGYRAIETLRLEKGYLYWSGDITPDYDPFQAGLGFCVPFKKKGNFLGRKALEERKKTLEEKLVCLTLDDYVPLYGGEPIVCDGDVIGVVTSGGYGHTVDKSIAYGYIPINKMEHTTFQVEAFGQEYDFSLNATVLYDPDRKQILA